MSAIYVASTRSGHPLCYFTDLGEAAVWVINQRQHDPASGARVSTLLRGHETRRHGTVSRLRRRNKH